MRRRTKGGGEEVREAGEAAPGCGNGGMAGGRRRGRAGKKRGGALEVEGAPDMWVPHVRERKRGRGGGREVGCFGPKAELGRGVGLDC
jgi:hypothetical protein